MFRTVALGPLGVGLVACVASVACGSEDDRAPAFIPERGASEDAPVVVSTVPEDGAVDVTPGPTELRVTFDRRMRDGNWSWVYGRLEDFPEVTGEPFFTDDGKTNVLPVTLESGRSYIVYINSPDNPALRNFEDEAGNTARPFRLDFSTL